MDVLGTNPNHKGLRVLAISFQNKPCVLELLVREHRPSLALSPPDQDGGCSKDDSDLLIRWLPDYYIEYISRTPYYTF